MAAIIAAALALTGCGTPSAAPDEAGPAGRVAALSGSATESTPSTDVTPRAELGRLKRLDRARNRAAHQAAEAEDLRQAAEAAASRARVRKKRAHQDRARTAAATNPLAGRTWGVYQGPREPTWEPYLRASGSTKTALGKIALAPKAVWFGAWIPDDEIATKVSQYIAASQHGDPDALVQMTVFRMVPWEHDACQRRASPAEQASYRTWIDRFAGAIGDTPTAIVLQPDGPFSLCAPGGPAGPAALLAYATRALSAHANTSVYIEIGAADWPAAGQGGVDSVLKFLLPAGIEDARGVALNGTHYSDTGLEIARGTAVVEALADRGITDKHFVVNTSGNGNPFEFGHYTGADPLNANVCRSVSDPSTCVTLGIPPTTRVAAKAWGLSRQARADARSYADGYLWFGRPWLYRQNYPFQMDRALGLVRSTPFR
ncbi:hypothetical protein BH11ACT8_BH11ACT8_05010 [soil metagenome]